MQSRQPEEIVDRKSVALRTLIICLVFLVLLRSNSKNIEHLLEVYICM